MYKFRRSCVILPTNYILGQDQIFLNWVLDSKRRWRTIYYKLFKPSSFINDYKISSHVIHNHNIYCYSFCEIKINYNAFSKIIFFRMCLIVKNSKYLLVLKFTQSYQVFDIGVKEHRSDNH